MARNKELSSETRQSTLLLRNEGYSIREIAKKLKILYNAVYYSLQNSANSNQMKVYLSREPNTTGIVHLTVNCLLTGSNQQCKLYVKKKVLGEQ